jgi:Sulfotransferase family
MSVIDYCAASARVAERAFVQRPRLGREERLVFVVGCPRSGTTFVGRAIGGLPGFVDLGEVTPWKAALPSGPSAVDLRTILERVRRFGLAWGLRGVEQTPENAHVLRTVLEAYPEALAVHALRDGRDVVCSLLERRWLNSDRSGTDDAGLAYGPEPRFWVEPERHEEFSQVSDARRCAWAWRRYVEAARAAVPAGRMLEVRYEELASVADRLAEFLGANVTSAHRAMDDFVDSSIGRWQNDLTVSQLGDVEAEAGPLLRELGYT